MASAVGKTPPKPLSDIKKENTSSKDQNKSVQGQQNASKEEKNQDNKPRARENRFQNNDNRNNQNRRGGFGGRNQNPRFNQRGNQPGKDGGGSNQYGDQSSGDFYGEQNDGPKEQKKFTGRCRLFVGNITPETTEEQFREMFTPFGEVSELFVNAGRGFGFIRLVSL